MAAEYDPSPSRLGRAATLRFTLPTQHSRAASARRPGASLAAMGQLAASARRFAAGIARPVEIRRQVAAPDRVRVKSFDAVSRPPRWWAPTLVDPAAGEAHSTPDLPERGLQRVMGAPPSEKTHVPGRFASTMKAQSVRVKRLKEVAEIGSLTSGAPKLTTPVRRSFTGNSGSDQRGEAGQSGSGPSGAGPGHASGDGDAHRPESGAVPHITRGSTNRGSRPPSRTPGRAGLLRRAWAGRQESVTQLRLSPGPARGGVPAPRPSPRTAPPVGPASVVDAASTSGPAFLPGPASPSESVQAPGTGAVSDGSVPDVAAAPSAGSHIAPGPHTEPALRRSFAPGPASSSSLGSARESVQAPVVGAAADGSGPGIAGNARAGFSAVGPALRLAAHPTPGGVLRRLLGGALPAASAAAPHGVAQTAVAAGLSRAAAALPGPDSPREVRVRRLTDTSRPPTGFAPNSTRAAAAAS
jgi:hypothetical protein